jgi:serine/threonine-protein kinase
MNIIESLNAALTDRYLVEREVGEGGMATVYLARDLRHNRHVALKVLKTELAAVVGAERFLTEIETTARLQHPNILPLFDSGEASGFLFYVMPYVEGESLADRLGREKQLPVDEAVRLAVEVAEALQSAHELGVVHRDIKPANILVSQGRPLVADFGIALAVSAAGGSRLTETGLSLGTPHYMSPEQATGDQIVGPASDVYSLGCVLYEMLVGEPPYTGSTAQAVLGRVITSDPDSVTSQRRAVPLHVDAVVARALEKLPADRFPSAEEFARALRDEGFRHGALRAGAASSPGLRAWMVAGWVVAALLGAGFLISSFFPEEAPPVRKFSLRIPPGFGPSEWLELAPDGSALVMADGPRGRSDPRSLVIRRLDDLVQIPIPESTGSVDPAFSPDGEMVAWGGRDGMYAAPVAGGTVRTLLDGEPACCLRWADDGYIYFSDEQSIRRVWAAGGDSELVLAAADNTSEILIYYEPLPGGKRAILNVLASGAEDRIDLVDVASGRRAALTEGIRPYVTRDGHLVFAREGGGLFGAPLDAGAMALTAAPVRLEEGVGVLIPPRVAMFSLSESGDLAYWTADDEVAPSRELVWVDREGEATPVDGSWRSEFESVSASPDGTRAAVTIGTILATEIWIKELDRGPARRLTNYQGMNRRPVWAPDGTALAFISDRGERRAVYTVPASGISTPELLLEHPGEEVDEVLWSSDGKWLVYRTGTSPGNRNIYARRLRPDTTTIAVAARPGADERAPALSPDGRWLAYVSNETGADEVWVRPFPDVGRGSRQLSVDGGVEPVWSESGNEIFFRGRQGLTTVAVEDTENFTTGEIRTLFPSAGYRRFTTHRAYDFEEGRNRFLMIRDTPAETAPPELIFVENFMEEVRAKAGG